MDLVAELLGYAYLALGIAGLIAVIVKRKHFYLWAAVPACLACCARGLQSIAFRNAVRMLKGNKPFDPEKIAHIFKRAETVSTALGLVALQLVAFAVFILWHRTFWKKR